MKKINFLAFGALLCVHFGVQASGNLSVVGTPSTTDSTSTAAKTYTFTYVASTGDVSTQHSFSLSASVPSLSDLAKGLQNLITSIPAAKLYVYNGAGTLLAPLSGLASINSSLMPAASSTTPTFFVSTASNLSADQLLTAAEQN